MHTKSVCMPKWCTPTKIQIYKSQQTNLKVLPQVLPSTFKPPPAFYEPLSTAECLQVSAILKHTFSELSGFWNWDRS